MIRDNAHIERGKVRYSTVAIILHWLIAALLIFEVGLGLRMEAAHGSTKFAIFQLHKSIGITILLLILLRLVWRLNRNPPAIAAKGWERALAYVVHTLFYLLLLALPISGWMIVSTSRIVVPTLLYGAVPWPHLPGLAEKTDATKQAWHSIAELVHVNLVNVIYALFALHVAGALKHHFLDRDGDFARMAPGTNPGSWNDPRLILIGIGVVMAAGLGLRWAPMGPGQSARSLVTETPTVTAPTILLTPAPAAPTVSLADPEGAAAATAEHTVLENSAEAAKEEVRSWAIIKGSTLGFRTSWSGQGIEGGFSRFNGDIAFSPDQLDRSRAVISIQMDSLFSGDSQRDETLKSADWFSVRVYGAATFKADRFRKTGTDRYVANGTLSLKGVTLPISLPFTVKISGNKATMQGTATVNRTDYKVGEGEYTSTSEIPAAVNIDVVIHATKR